MKTSGDKIKMSVTLDEHESHLIREAAKIVLREYGDSQRWTSDFGEFTKRKSHRRILTLALLAFCRGVIQAGKSGDHEYPMVADSLRRETPLEIEERIAWRKHGHGLTLADGLSPAELRWCETEGVDPAEFLKKRKG